MACTRCKKKIIAPFRCPECPDCPGVLLYGQLCANDGNHHPLWTDDFSAYSNGATPGSPMWGTTLTGSGGTGPFPSVSKVAGNLLRGTIILTGSSSTRTACFPFTGYSALYPDFPTTACGIYMKCTYKGSTGEMGGGPCLGIGTDISAHRRIRWNVLSGSIGYSTASGNWGNWTNLITGIPTINVNDVLELRLKIAGAFGWELSGYVNGSLIGTSTDSNIQCPSLPKRPGFHFGGVAGVFTGTKTMDFANFEAGLI